MIRMGVTSSNVAEIGFDPKERVLEVLFLNGNAYQYAPVSEEQHVELMESESIGRKMNELKRNPMFRTTRVYQCCSEPFDSTVIRHECSTAVAS